MERLKKILRYSRATGLFVWNLTKGSKAVEGEVAGTLDVDGYVIIRIAGVNYRAHRLAYLYVEGYWPEYEIDHRKGDRADNRWKEIRHVTNACNMQNCKLSKNNGSGFNGVSWAKHRNKWVAKVMLNRRQISLGSHEDPISAALARVAWEECSPDWHCNHRAENRVKLRCLGYKV